MSEITNLRSLGGYKISEDQQVREGLLYRSSQLFKLNSTQQDYLKNKLKIQKIYDMRGESERDKFPDTVWNGCDYEVLDILKEAMTNNASLENMIKGVGDADERMLDTYTELALSSSAQKYYHEFIKDLISFNKPIIFHCFAGKDRTGIGAVIILKILGVSDDDIMHDYLLTNIERREANQEILLDIKDKVTPNQLEEVKVALLVKDIYLLHYYGVINKKFGNFNKYLRNGLKLTTKDLLDFRKKYSVKIN